MTALGVLACLALTACTIDIGYEVTVDAAVLHSLVQPSPPQSQPAAVVQSIDAGSDDPDVPQEWIDIWRAEGYRLARDADEDGGS